MEQQLFTISVFTENQVGLLNRISIIFTRRGLNLESVSSSASAIHGIHKMNFTCTSDRETMEKVILPTHTILDEKNFEKIIRVHNARILELTRDYTIIEKTGHESETQALYNVLARYDILQFIRSGRICITKNPTEHFSRFLEEQEKRRAELLETLENQSKTI